MAEFRRGLQQLGWVEDGNLRIDLRFATDPDLARLSAAELVRIGPDVIVTYTAPSTRAVEEQTQSIPIVFITLGDNFGPVPDALVKSVARPEGNMTGVDNFYDSIRSKCPSSSRRRPPTSKEWDSSTTHNGRQPQD
jgi:putative ABC transport system substrate-binding protein